MFVGGCLATKAFIGKLYTGYDKRVGHPMVYRPMMKGGMGQQNSYQRYLNWDAFGHASHAPQLRSDKYYLWLTYVNHLADTYTLE